LWLVVSAEFPHDQAAEAASLPEFPIDVARVEEIVERFVDVKTGRGESRGGAEEHSKPR